MEEDMNKLSLLSNYKGVSSLSFVENIDESKLKIIIDNFDELYPLIGKLKDKKKGFCEIVDKKTILTMLEKRLKNKKNEFTYKNRGEGRMYADGLNLCTMNKVLRHTLSNGLNKEIDMDNCHPVILDYYAKHWGLEHRELENYVNNREEILSKVMVYNKQTRSEAKMSILCLLNDENKKLFPDDPCFNLYLEIKRLQDKVITERKDLYIKAKKNHPENSKGSCMAYFLQSGECKIIQVCILYCKEKNLNLSSYEFDGTEIYLGDLEKYGESKLLNELSIEVKSKFDLDCKFSIKEMDRMMNIDFSKYEVLEDNFDISVVGDEFCGIYVLNKLIENKRIFYNEFEDDLYCYNAATKLYEVRDIEYLMVYVSKYCKEFFIQKGLYLTGKNYSLATRLAISKKINSITSTTGQRAILTQIKIRLPKNGQFIDENFDRIPYLFPIADNKVIDFRTNEVRDRVKTDYFTKTTNIVYNPDVEIESVRQFIREYLIPTDKKILDDDDEKHIDCFLSILGYCCTGFNHLKKIVSLVGKKDGGKSTLTNKCLDVFGSFSEVADKRVVCVTGAESVHSAHLFPILRKRIVTCPELSTTDRPNVTLLKSVSGEDKKQSMRGCAAKKQNSQTVDCKFWLSTNELFTSTDNQLLERILVFFFMNKFPSGTMTIEKKKFIKNLDLASVIFKYAHKFIKNDMQIDYSKQVVISSHKETSLCNNVNSFFNQFYENSLLKKDRISKNDIFDKFKDFYPDDPLSKHKYKFYRKFEENLDLSLQTVDKLTGNIILYAHECYNYLKKRETETEDSETEYESENESIVSVSSLKTKCKVTKGTQKRLLK